MKKLFFKSLAIGLLALLPAMSWAQAVTSYNFATGVDATKWVTLSSPTQILTPGTYTDSQASSVVSIGFTFNFGGTNYTQFSVNTDGNFKFGSTATGTSGYSNPFSSSYANTNAPKINFMGCDGKMKSTGYVKSELFGTEPNRYLVVEYSNTAYNEYSKNQVLSWQIQLFETSNKILVVYGTAPSVKPSATLQVGMCTSASDIVLVNLSSNTRTNYTSGASATSSGSNWPAAGRYYEFTQPSCVAPSDLATSNISTSGATVSWTATSAAEYQYVCVSKGTTPSWTSPSTTSATSATVNGLNAGSDYDFYVRSDCGSEQSATSKISFQTECTKTSVPYTQNFDNTTATTYNTNGELPACWSSSVTPSSATATTYNPHVASGSYCWPSSGSNALSFYGNGYCYAVLPDFDAAVNELEIQFSYRMENKSYGTLVVGYITNADVNMNTFSSIKTITSKDAITQTEKISMASAPSNAARVVLRWYYNGQYACAVDDISVTKALAKPTNLAVSSKDATSATFTFNHPNNAGKWFYEVSKKDNSWSPSSEVVSSDTITAKTFTVNGLVSGKTYYARVKYVEGTSESASSDIVPVTTDCQVADFPFEEDFANGVTACWVKLGSGSISGTSNLWLTNAAVLLPEINMGTQALSGCQLNFKMEVYSSSTPVTVKVIAAPSREASQDPTTLSVVATFDIEQSSSTVTKNCEVFLSSATSIDFTTNKYLGFYTVGSGKTAVFDDVVLKVATGMRLPENIQISEITHNSAKVTFEQPGGGDEWRYQVSKNSSFSDAGEGTVVTSTTINLTGLDSKTTYYFRIRQEMDEEDHWTDAVNFTTDCAPLQYTTIDFESFTASTSTTYGDSYVPSCWTSGSSSGSNSYKPFVSKYTPYSGTNYHSATNYLYMSGSSSYYSWMALPPLDATDKAKNVVMTFWARTSSSSKYTLKVGVMSDPEDQTTFTSVKDFEIGSTSYAEFTVEFNQYTGSDKYIAFMVDKNYGTFYIDDVTFEYITCAAPQNATVTNITTTTATLNVGFNDKDWSWKMGEAGAVTNVAAGTSSASLSGLTAGEAYSVFAKTRCGGEDGESSWFKVDFRTKCNPIAALGYTEDFADGIPTCMDSIGDKMWSNGLVQLVAGEALILPIFESATDWTGLQLTFDGSTNSTSDPYVKIIAYEEGVALASQEVLDTKELSSASTGVDVYLNEIADINTKLAGKRIAIYRAVGSAAVNIDNISIKAASQFKAPENLALTAESETAEGASFTFEQPGEVKNVWVVEVATANSFSTVLKRDTINALSFTLTGLNMKTKYYVRVKQMDGEVSSSFSNVVEFTTECGTLVLKNVYTMEDFIAGTSSRPDCWGFKGYYDSYKPYVYNNTSYNHTTGGSKSMRLQGGNNYTPSMFTMPAVDSDVNMNMVTVTFWAVSSYYSGYELKVGVLNSAETYSSSAFKIAETVKVTSTMQQFTVRFKGLSLTDAHRYITFAMFNSSTSAYIYVDDIKVSESACDVATGAAASAVTATSATISITNATPDWNVVVREGATEAFAQSDITASSVAVSNLKQATDYVAYITMNCQGGGVSDTVEVKFTTLCKSILSEEDMPLFEGFELNKFSDCWPMIAANKPTINGTSSQAKTGNYLVNFCGASSTAKVMILPEVDFNLQSYRISFWGKMWSSTAGDIKVALAEAAPTTQAEVLALPVVATFNVNGAAHTQYSYDFYKTKTSGKKFIVIYMYGTGDISFDDLKVEKIDLPWETLREGLNTGRMYTTCQAKNILAVKDGVLFEPEDWDGSAVTFVEADTIKAGYGYLLVPEKPTVQVVFGDESVTTAAEDAPNGMQGTLVAIDGTGGIYLPVGNNYCGVNAENHLQYFGQNNTMPANRAYIVIDKIGVNPTNAPVSARRLTIGSKGSVTGIDNVVFGETTERMKMIVNDQLVIIRNGKVYNAQGQVVK